MKRTEITCPNGHEEFEVKILGTKPDPKLMLKCKECDATKEIPMLMSLWTTNPWEIGQHRIQQIPKPLMRASPNEGKRQGGRGK